MIESRVLLLQVSLSRASSRQLRLSLLRRLRRSLNVLDANPLLMTHALVSSGLGRPHLSCFKFFLECFLFLEDVLLQEILFLYVFIKNLKMQNLKQ